MTASRQLPLFTLTPKSAADLSARTPLKFAIPFFQAYLYKEGKSDYTVTSFTSDLSVFADHADGDTPLGQFNTERLNEFLQWMEHERGVPCSRKTYARRVTTLKVFFKWLADNNYLERDPAFALLQRSGPAPLSLILTDEQVEACIAVATLLRLGKKPDARPELLFRLIVATGIKKGEAAALELEHIERAHPKEPMLMIQHTSAKNVYKERRLALDPAWLALLDEYRGQYRLDKHLFTCTARNLEYILEDVGKGADIPFKVSFEMLRWTCAVRNYAAGIAPSAIRDQLGLSEISWRETFQKIRRLAGEDIEAYETEDDDEQGED
ncbi:MAG: site-specific integrase [Chloroflexota bacterium]|nr:site-specific integrase [Chloroflexota bacterium]